jgi:hypothetical protein
MSFGKRTRKIAKEDPSVHGGDAPRNCSFCVREVKDLHLNPAASGHICRSYLSIIVSHPFIYLFA